MTDRRQRWEGGVPGSYHDALRQMMDQLRTQRGVSLLESLKRIIDLSKSNGDGDAVVSFSKRLIDAAWHEARLDFEMLAFGELKSLYERDSKYADLRKDVLWYYKWVAEHLTDHVEVSAEQIESTLASMEQFYRSEKEGLRPVFAVRCRAAAMMGKWSQAQLFAEQWEKSAEQESDDCAACQTHLRVEYLLTMGRAEQAVEAAAPILRGEQACTEVPATTFSRLLIPLLLMGEAELALVLSGAVRRQVRLVPNLVGYLADHVIFLSVIGALGTARRLASIMMARSETAMNAYDRFQSARAAWIFLAQWAKQGNLQIQLPRRLGLAASGQQITMGRAIEHFQNQARELGRAFDARNGTDRFQKLVEVAEQLARLDPPGSSLRTSQNSVADDEG